MSDSLYQIKQQDLDDIYASMLIFANNQLNNEHYAKDVVQDTFVNALKYADSFKGKSALKTWIFAILKNKIADFIRQNQQYVNMTEMQTDNDATQDGDFLDLLFDDIGHWQTGFAPNAFDDSWYNPEKVAQSDDFWQVFEVCLNYLPQEQARAFLMKEYIELDTKEICQELNISSQNFYVLIHRARLRLQSCLSAKWFLQ